MTKAKIKSVLLTVVLCVAVTLITGYAIAGFIFLLPEEYQDSDFYPFSPFHVLIFLIMLMVAFVTKMKVTNCKVRSFFAGVFKYGIIMMLFCVIYIVVSLIWLKKWGWVYLGGSARIKEFLLKNILFYTIAGISEEFVYRGVVLNLLLKEFSIENRKDRMIACLCGAVIFGLAHATGFLAGQGVMTTISQMIGASLIGIYFSAIYLRTNNIFSVMFLHALYNYSLDCVGLTMETPKTYFICQNVLVVIGIMLIALFIQGIIMLWKGKFEEVSTHAESELAHGKKS